MTPSELELAARERYNAVGDPHFTTNLIMDTIYQASMVLATECNIIEKTYQTTSVDGQREYGFPSNTIAIRRVTYKNVKIYPVELENDPKTRSSEPAGTPSQYGIWQQELVLFPTPNITADVIKVFTYARPQRVSAGSTLEIPEEYHIDMIELILSVMYAKDGNQGMSTYHRDLWRDAVKRIKRSVAKKRRGDEFAVVRDQEELPVHPGVLL